MGPGYIGIAAVVFANIALAATLATTVHARNTVTRLTDPTPATSHPIRTVITVNSHGVDVVAADDGEVLKVTEKLRELCSGPLASRYPEICDHLETDGTDEDVNPDAVGPSVGSPPEESRAPQLTTTTSTNAYGSTPELPSPILSSPTLAEETGFEHAPDTPRSLYYTVTVTAASKATKTLEIAVHEVSGLESSVSLTGVVRGESSDRDQAEVPTTFETKIKSSAGSITIEPTVEAESNTGTGTPSIRDESNTLPLFPVSTAHQSEVTLWPSNLDGPSAQSTATTEITDGADNHVSSSSTTPKLWPVFDPIASPRPSRPLTSSFHTPLAEVSTTTNAPAAIPSRSTALSDCTQTLKVLEKLAENPRTATRYASTVTSTAFISCSCPNLETEYIYGYGHAIAPRTTTTVDATKIEKLVRCAASQTSLLGTG
ncbi:hypothetical protein V8F20_011010 [Naviculisporaceae sp. PSN 640]